MTFNERNQMGRGSEQTVRAELEDRGWFVHPWGRSSFPPAINNAVNLFRDTYSRPCRLRFQPDFLIVRPGDPQTLKAVEVKCSGGHLNISRLELNAQLRMESEFWTPVLIVFHTPGGNEDQILRVIPVGEALMSGKSMYGTGDAESCSGEPYFQIDPNKTHPFDKFFGTKP